MYINSLSNISKFQNCGTPICVSLGPFTNNNLLSGPVIFYFIMDSSENLAVKKK